jgi:hypothetical protein
MKIPFEIGVQKGFLFYIILWYRFANTKTALNQVKSSILQKGG